MPHRLPLHLVSRRRASTAVCVLLPAAASVPRWHVHVERCRARRAPFAARQRIAQFSLCRPLARVAVGAAVHAARRQELLGLKLSQLQKLASSLGVPTEQVGPYER